MVMAARSRGQGFMAPRSVGQGCIAARSGDFMDADHVCARVGSSEGRGGGGQAPRAHTGC